MTVVLLILKIIGIVLLVLLAILLLLLLLALFVPVRYRLKGKYTDKPDVCGSVSWLFHIVSFRFAYREDAFTDTLRIFGIPWKHKESDDDDGFHDADKSDEDKSGYTDESDHGETDGNGLDRAADMPPRRKRTRHRRKKPRIGIKKRIREKICSIKRLFRKIGDLKKKAERLLKDPACQKAFGHLKKEFFLLLKRISPKKLKLNAGFSTGSPDTTGEVLGVLALFPVVYKNRWNITPDFESEQFYIRADCDIRGRIFAFRLLGIALRIFFDKNCRKLYHKITN